MEGIKYKGFDRLSEMNTNQVKTLGQLSLDQEINRKDNTHSVAEQVAANLSGYHASFMKTLEAGIKKYGGMDFYIETLFADAIVIKECHKIFQVARRTCPDPWYDRGVYKYHYKDARVEFLWVLPDPEICKEMLSPGYIPILGGHDLYTYVQDFNNGKLQHRSNEENSIKKKISMGVEELIIDNTKKIII